METPRDPHAPQLALDHNHPGKNGSGIPLRYVIISMLFFVTTINNADRATLGVTGPSLTKDLGLDPAQLGIVLSAFGWSYALAQLPGGWLLDRFGSYRVYTWCIVLWSLFTLLQGFVGMFNAATAIVLLFILRLLVGLAEAPSFPANGRIVASWFPTKERGTASAIFNSAQYFATVIFAPLMGVIIHYLGWRYVFWVMGGLGLVLVWPWVRMVMPPKIHPRMTVAELSSIEAGGALVSMDDRRDAKSKGTFRWSAVKELLTSRMMIGVYLGQYCIATITAFFLTWFVTYLVKDRQMTILTAGFVAVLPALCGFCGGILGGVFSDYLLRRGYSLTFARKLPIVAGMLLSCTIVICNYVKTDTVPPKNVSTTKASATSVSATNASTTNVSATSAGPETVTASASSTGPGASTTAASTKKGSNNWLIVLFMCLAFFGKGIGALGWTVVSDTAPKQVMGTCGGLFNMFGNISTITTPIAVGYIIKHTGGFNGALVFVGAHAIGAVLCYLLVVGKIQRLELKPEPEAKVA